MKFFILGLSIIGAVSLIATIAVIVYYAIFSKMSGEGWEEM